MSHAQAHPNAQQRSDAPRMGVRIAGVGHYVPEKKLTNADLEKMLDTSDEWITQRTGIKERRICDHEKGESNRVMAAGALERALADARMEASELDCVIVGTCTSESPVPSVACRISDIVGAGKAAAFDLVAGCSGFAYALNVAHSMIASGAYRSVGVVGCDEMSSILDYKDRSICILFGDAAGAAILRVTDDPSKGLLAQAMHADGSGWPDLHMPRRPEDIPEGVDPDSLKLGTLQMNGRSVYRFAVGTFSNLIQETLDKAGLTADEVDHFVCHQSNARILEAARERFGLPEEKLYINIDRYGNTSAGSAPLCLSELRQMGRIKDGDLVMIVAFGAGLTWASSLWRI